MMDTPAIKITYDSRVVVNNSFSVHMSANQTAHYPHNETFDVYEFKNQIEIPSYLIAIAVGDLEYRSLGDRVGVITEPINIDSVAEELSNLQTMLDTAEDYLTRYIWGNYSIIILPPSFPMGGMENPLLTFASPAIITGDKSQVDVATHEIAHSWTGNDVTCENWSNFWLNEGFTVFEERKVTARIHNDTDVSKVAAYLGNITMYQDMLGYGLDSNYSSLYPIVGNALPDDSFSNVPYEKGFQLLYYMEQELLGEDNMQKLLRSYILDHQQTSVTYDAFVEHFETFVEFNYNASQAQSILSRMDWDAWVHSPGLPPVQLDFTTPKLIESSSLADEYIELGGASSPDNYTHFMDYYSNLKVVFIERLNTRIAEVDLAILERIDNDLNITHTIDPECKERWFPLGIRENYTAVFDPAHEFISGIGRLKYL